MKTLSLLLFTSALVLGQTAQDVVLLQNCRLIDGTGRAPRDKVSIVIRGERIESVTPGAQPKLSGANVRKVDLAGKTVMPGLINGHGHLGITRGNKQSSDAYTDENITQQLTTYERYGVTTVMALGMNRDPLYALRDRQKEGKLGGAAILTADRGIGTPDGVPGAAMGPLVYRPANAEEARRVVDDMASRNPDLIKIWVDDGLGKSPRPKPEVYGAAIEETHKRGLRIAAHVFYLDDAKALVRDGVDILAHSVRDKPVDDELIQLMKQHGTWYIPTLALEDAFFIYADKPSWVQSDFFRNALDSERLEALLSPAYAEKLAQDASTASHRKFLKQAEENLKAMANAGVQIGFGTDSGAFPGRVQGPMEHRELYLMVAAGLTPLDAIHSATGRNAQMLHVAATTGTVAPGKLADLIVADGDPSAAIENTTRIAAVWHRGREVVALHQADAAVKW